MAKRKFHWYIVGDGADREEIAQKIRDLEMDDYITMTGLQNNPYPYMHYADLFVLCSKWESYGMVVVESLITGTPVVAGDYPALHEILTDGENGQIVVNTPEGIATAVAGLINDSNKYRMLKSGAEKYHYSPDPTYSQLLELMGV